MIGFILSVALLAVAGVLQARAKRVRIQARQRKGGRWDRT